ncbi:MAG: hypothetical protein H6908_02660 [Hyphomicrobiales bacterium]|nr:hypothetical protein [Rickettsiales bacterium]MCP5361534.1 hypothetical protein [Hyphomicrobiales bacterium]
MKHWLKYTAAAMIAVGSVNAAQASDKSDYEAGAKAVVASLVGGETSDIDGLIAKLDAVTAHGVALAKATAEKHQDGKTLLDFLVANIDKVKAASLESMEADWHHGGAFKSAGIDHDSFDHYGPVIGAKDAVIHPITAAVALKAYKEDNNEEHLEQAQEELEEILGQLKYVDVE